MNLHIMPLSNIFSSMSRRFAVVACAALLFASCDNISLIDSSEEDEKIDGKCIVTFGIAENIDSRAVTGTVLPTSVDTSTLSYKLQAALPEDTELPANALPEDLGEGKDYASYEDLQTASFNLDSGKWIFYLFAYKSGELVLTGEETVNIKAGANPVVFNMVASESGTGSVKVILNCYLGSETCSEITGVTATFLRPNGTALAEGTLTQQTPRFTTADDSGIEYTDSSGKAYTLVEYENTAVPKGSYLLKFEITLQYETIATDGETTIYNTTTSYYTVGVTVEPGSLSEKTDDITDLKQRYSITYMNVKDDGTTEPFTDWDDGAEPVTYYNPNSTQAVSLPSRNVISRTDKSFTGWYDSYTEGAAGAVGTYGALTTSFKPKDGGTSTKGAKVYYAKWGDLDLYVSASENSSLGGGNDTTGDGTISNPYATMAQAFAHIRANSNDKLAWTVYVDGQVAGMAIDSSAVGTALIDDTAIITIKTLTIRGYTPEVSDYTDALVGVSGKALSVSISKPVIIKDLRITRGSGDSGAGLTVTSSAVVTLEGVTVTGNNTQSGESDVTPHDGGGISNAGTLVLENCIITNNRASRNGGGVYNQGTLYILGNTVIGGDDEAGNTAGVAGGGIYNQSILNTEAANASAAILGNTAPSGAGIYNNGGNCIVHNLKMSGNTANGAADGNGGGAIWNDGTLAVVDVTMTENTTAAAGGAIYSTGTNASLEIEQGVFTLNTAHTSGGAVWSSGNITISGSSTELTEFSSNTATNGSGGAVYCGAAITATSQIRLNENRAAESGGAIYAAGAISLVTGDINKNTAENANGGAIYAGKSFTVTNAAYMTENKALNGSGGAIYAVGKVTILNGSIRVNKVKTSGGGIYIAGTGSELANLVISGNIAEAGSGGGIYIANGAGATLTGMTIGATDSANTALTGGGVYNAGTLTVSGGTISYNTATASGETAGAGIYTSGTLTVKGNASVSNNTTTSGWGGGVYNAGTFTVQAADDNSPSISENTAVNGAGVYTSGENAVFTMSAGTIGGNTASTNGGGVYNAGTMFMYGSAVVGDSGASGVATDSAYSNKANQNGGGIYNSGKLYIGYSSYISDSENTKSVCSEGVKYNYAANGGGIYNTSSSLMMNSGMIMYNAVSANGAGVYNDAEFIFSEGTVADNSAENGSGGGIYNNGTTSLGANAIVGYASATENASSEDNTAEAYYHSNYANTGGGIYNNTGKTLTLASGSLIYYNFGGVGGGIYNAGILEDSGGFVEYNKANKDANNNIYNATN